MNQEDITRMAREAGFVGFDGSNAMLRKFAALVAAAEREACAKVCDVLAVHPEYASDITKVAAQAIRARGNT
jgi:hypothetical protein